mmetsp:Transcript_28122/g.82338  ORF Transcript_28122/g.82338 Transcript_28122/m.82338 type:complete len:179 (-) Transcript_28122:136-672(-)
MFWEIFEDMSTLQSAHVETLLVVHKEVDKDRVRFQQDVLADRRAQIHRIRQDIRILASSLVPSNPDEDSPTRDIGDGWSAAVWQHKNSAWAVRQMEDELKTKLEEMREAFSGLMSVFEQASGENESILDFLLDMFSDGLKGSPAEDESGLPSPSRKPSGTLATRQGFSASNVFSSLWS